jgi:hypothetical protein
VEIILLVLWLMLGGNRSAQLNYQFYSSEDYDKPQVVEDFESSLTRWTTDHGKDRATLNWNHIPIWVDRICLSDFGNDTIESNCIRVNRPNHSVTLTFIGE